MARPRDPNLREKLAATLLMYWEAIGQGIPFAEAQQLSADQILSLVEFDHARKAAHGEGQDPCWVNHPTNLTPRLYKDHRAKTAKRDHPEMCKGRRLARDHERHLAVRSKILSLPDTRPDKPRTRWPKGRKIQNGQKLRSRSSFQKAKNNGR